ncbi:MAG: selenocysteine-specific translation elongation factor [Betaproteobacteria bacterium]|jgi:selenocysteine-specific elongation factor|nr:selenocysteine-specific translation elongation factor [Betaproteobacteria bacterium]
MIVATAGHIDHGKTLLVKRLTGIDTDRLPEEKRRGISIDIGFAHLRLPDGSAIGFIDVPGHERFVRNMLAGVSGIDFVLLVVAADDGVMPQTREHLAILDLLDVRQGLLVITKVDRVAPERIEAVTAELRALVADTVLRDAPVLAVSAMTGDGVDALRETLVARLSAQRLGASEGRHFRLAIDRCFTVAGSGTVVTGTIFAGRVKVGDTLSLSPSGVTVRVRGLQVQGRTVEQATAGARCAVNLTGADLQKDSITRGEWLVDPAIHAPTSRIDVHLRALATEANPLRHWTPVHLHLGTADVTGRLSTRRDLSVAPGTAEVAQIVLDQPVGAIAGDRFIVRDFSAQRTIGGGHVVDPFPPPRRRRIAERQLELAALDGGAPSDVLQALLPHATAGIDVALFERRFNLTADAAQRLYKAAGLQVLGRESRRAFEPARLATMREALLAEVRSFHVKSPQATGIELAVLQKNAGLALPDEILQAVLRDAVQARTLELTGGLARLPGFDAAANSADEAMWKRVRPLLSKTPNAPPQVREIAATLKLDEKALQAMLQRRIKRGELVRIDPQRVYLRTAIVALARLVEATAQAVPGGQFNAAQYRDQAGIGRSLAIQILEHFDSAGLTLRVGDARKLRRKVSDVYREAAQADARPDA